MLYGLCGNKNVQRILIFLFVNGRAYGAELQRAFKVSLTPLQKALERLERGGLLMSHYEGKTRLYRFNPAYPLLAELEQLVKKAYTLLSAEEKKAYYVEAPRQDAHNKFQTLLAFWDKLSAIGQVTFMANSQDPQGWKGRGKGEVKVTRPSGNVLYFHEKGSWHNSEGKEVGFTNAFRWTLDRTACLISLEHLRRGPDHPVFLFHLAPSGHYSLASVDSHLCEGDTYFGQIHFNAHALHLNWRVIGPKKNEEINYYYANN